MMSSVNKYKISVEPAKHINERARKLLHQAVEASESNIENRTRRWKTKSIGIVTDYYKFLHDKNTKSDNNYTFLHGKTTNQIKITGFCAYLTRAIMD